MMILGTMEGNVRIIKDVHLDSREEIFQDLIHNKYVIRTKWGDNYFATASYDKTVNLYKIEDSNDGINYKHIQKWSFSGNVEAMEFTPDGISLVVATRGDNYLNYIQLRDLSVNKFSITFSVFVFFFNFFALDF